MDKKRRVVSARGGGEEVVEVVVVGGGERELLKRRRQLLPKRGVSDDDDRHGQSQNVYTAPLARKVLLPSHSLSARDGNCHPPMSPHPPSSEKASRTPLKDHNKVSLILVYTENGPGRNLGA